jgi:hypothetical protein
MTNAADLPVLLHRPGHPAVKDSCKGTYTIAEFVSRHGAIEDDWFIFVESKEDADGDVDAEIEVVEVSKDRRLGDILFERVLSLHCHHCKKVHVTVNYNGKDQKHHFPPTTRVRHVLRWAKKKFEQMDADADNLALFLCGSEEKVRENVHVGDLTNGKTCDICFDMSKEVNPAG